MPWGRRLLHFACWLLLPSIAPFAAETADAPSPLPKTVAVAAFKNGLAFVLREGQVRLEDGTGRISPIPNATLGTLWLSTSSPDARIDEIVAYRYNVAAEQPIDSITGILLANPGKTVTINYMMKEFTGEIVGLKSPANPSVEPVSASNPDTPAPSHHPEYLLLRVDKKLMAFPLGGISLASLPDDAVLSESNLRQNQALRIKIKGGSARPDLTMGYLEHGLGWTPSYLVSLVDDTHATLTMQAVVTNDVEDIRDAELFFVVGVPNFVYADTLSPMSLQQSLMDLMKDAERDQKRMKSFGAFSNNALTSQMIALDEAVGGPVLAPSVDELASAPEEDLFLYNRSGVTLARGERASYNVFASDVACEHIYSWEAEDKSRVDAFGNLAGAGQGTPDGSHADSVWHAIRLKNSTKFPWTSAPAMVISGTRPVSQDTLPYAPRGSSSILKITVATDIRASHEEREVARQPDPTHRRGYNFDLVTVEGKLKVKNYKTKQVELSIGKTLRGKAESESDGGTAVELGEGIESDNPRSRLSWETTLKPGEERVLTYRYRIWVRV